MGALRSDLRYAPALVDVERRRDGSMLLRSPQGLGPYARCAPSGALRLLQAPT